MYKNPPHEEITIRPLDDFAQLMERLGGTPVKIGPVFGSISPLDGRIGAGKTIEMSWNKESGPVCNTRSRPL